MVEHRLFEYEPNKPVGFFFHSSIKKEFQRNNLKADITEHGGKVLDTPSGADTVLVDEKHIKSIRSVQLHYSMSRDKRVLSVIVEPIKFIRICLKTGRFRHITPDRREMGGRPAGRGGRNKFTDEEDELLCWYLSRIIPDPTEGGRLTLGTYVELVKLGDEDDEYAWVRRHPASSWHEHYRKNRDRFNPIIQKFVDEYPPNPFALYGYSRRINKKNKRSAKVIEITDGSEDDSLGESFPDFEDLSQDSEESFQDRHVKPSKRKPSKRKPSKRPRIDMSSSPSSEASVPFEAEMSPSHFRESPAAPEVFQPQTPAPSPTLVNKEPQLFHERPSDQIVHSPPHPSPSFRDVHHSSPALPSRLPSNNTSRTEPSSRSLAVLSGLSHPPQNTGNPPPESSILRESAHKQSSPIPALVRKAARRPKPPNRQPFSPPSTRREQESTWAPFKNTRSRSHSVEPIPLQTARKRAGGKRPVQRHGVPLASVLEGGIEQEREEEGEGEEAKGKAKRVPESRGKDQMVGTIIMTETIQEEHDVEDLLMAQSNGTLSITVSKARSEVAEVEEQDHRAEETLRFEKHPIPGQDPLFMLDSDDDAIDQMMVPFHPERESVTIEGKGKGKERVWMKDEEEESEEENLVESEARLNHHPHWRASPDDDDDDDEINRIQRSDPQKITGEIKASSRQQHPFNSYASGSPLRARDQNKRTVLPLSTSANPPKQPSRSKRTRRTTGVDVTSIKPSSLRTPREAPHTPTTQLLQRPKVQVTSSSKRSQVPSGSRPHRSRRSSLESVNSEVPFPLFGTKASSIKAQMEQQLKQTPYKPPLGTKAAAARVAERQLRSQKQ